MTTGFIFSILTGLCWVVVSVLMTRVSRSSSSNGAFYVIGTFLGGLASLLLWLPSHEGLDTIPVLILYLCGAAFFNAANQLVQIFGLKQKNCAMYFSLCQLHFIFSFVVMAIFFAGQVNICNILGIVAIAGGIVTSGLLNTRKQDSLMPSPRDFLLGFLGIGLGGMASVLLLRAGTIPGAPATLKIGLMMSFNSCFHLLRLLLMREKINLPALKPVLPYGVGWAMLAGSSYAFIFLATRHLEPLGRTGLIYAIACATNIIGYWLYSVLFLKTGTSLKQILIMLLLLAGIIVFRLG